jgi:hypothetical protein
VGSVTGALVGYAASRTMDAATTRYYARQSERSRAREEEIAHGGTLVQLGHQLAGATGRTVDDAEAGRIGLGVHRTRGVLYGVGAAALTRRGLSPLVAGPLTGALAWLVVDEGLSVPTAFDYCPESHIRGVIGHGTWGLAAGLLLALAGVLDGRGTVDR